MRVFDHLPAATKDTSPPCRCGRYMAFSRTVPPEDNTDSLIRIYECQCGHELHLTVWESDALA
jgi:hypothetical protein